MTTRKYNKASFRIDDILNENKHNSSKCSNLMDVVLHNAMDTRHLAPHLLSDYPVINAPIIAPAVHPFLQVPVLDANTDLYTFHSDFMKVSPRMYKYFYPPPIGSYNSYLLASSKRKGGQVRFTPQQTQILEKRFLTHKYLSPEERRTLAIQLHLSDRQVKTWFQNRRAKYRRSVCTDINRKHSQNSTLSSKYGLLKTGNSNFHVKDSNSKTLDLRLKNNAPKDDDNCTSTDEDEEEPHEDFTDTMEMKHMELS